MVRAEVHAVLHRAGAGDGHREAAREILERASAHLGGADRERFWTASPVAALLGGASPDAAHTTGEP